MLFGAGLNVAKSIFRSDRKFLSDYLESNVQRAKSQLTYDDIKYVYIIIYWRYAGLARAVCEICDTQKIHKRKDSYIKEVKI